MGTWTSERHSEVEAIPLGSIGSSVRGCGLLAVVAFVAWFGQPYLRAYVSGTRLNSGKMTAATSRRSAPHSLQAANPLPRRRAAAGHKGPPRVLTPSKQANQSCCAQLLLPLPVGGGDRRAPRIDASDRGIHRTHARDMGTQRGRRAGASTRACNNLRWLGCSAGKRVAAPLLSLDPLSQLQRANSRSKPSGADPCAREQQVDHNQAG
jgi:hypothetical protein